MKRIAIISAMLEDPEKTQQKFNEIVSANKEIIKGRLRVSMEEEEIAVIYQQNASL